MRANQLRKVFVLTLIGTILEWYDFAIFGVLISVISQLFFPHNEKSSIFLYTLVIFATGFLARPVGGLLFGYIGDKIGRKASILISMMLMACSTMAIGLLPTYQTVGMMAPILLAIMRILQGLSVSGEHTGVITFMSELIPPSKKHFLLSFSFMGVKLGMLLGSIVGYLIFILFSKDTLFQYAWRIPFLVGTIIALSALYLRFKIEESPAFKEIIFLKNPLMAVVKSDKKKMAAIIGIFGLNAVAFYTTFIYFPSHLIHEEIINESLILAISSLNMLVMLAVMPIVGFYADRIGSESFIRAGALGFLILSYPLFVMIHTNILAYIILGQCILGILNGILLAPTPAVYTGLFASNKRFSGIALSINLSATLFGGTAPLVMALLQKYSHILWQSAYIIALAVVANISLNLIKPAIFKNKLVCE